MRRNLRRVRADWAPRDRLRPECGPGPCRRRRVAVLGRQAPRWPRATARNSASARSARRGDVGQAGRRVGRGRPRAGRGDAGVPSAAASRQVTASSAAMSARPSATASADSRCPPVCSGGRQAEAQRAPHGSAARPSRIATAPRYRQSARRRSRPGSARGSSARATKTDCGNGRAGSPRPRNRACRPASPGRAAGRGRGSRRSATGAGRAPATRASRRPRPRVSASGAAMPSARSRSRISRPKPVIRGRGSGRSYIAKRGDHSALPPACRARADSTSVRPSRFATSRISRSSSSSSRGRRPARPTTAPSSARRGPPARRRPSARG